jgi:hypothetical protein
MTDILKNFIQQHRDAFDPNVPGAHGWTGVKSALDRLQSADGLERSIAINRVLLDTEEPAACVWENIHAHLDGLHGSDDPLECFIRQNREGLDTAIPHETLWQNIEKGIPGAGRPTATIVRVNWQRHLLRIAASLTLLIAGIGIGTWYAHSTAAAGMDMADVSNEYGELEQYYQRDIATKQQKLATFTGNRPAEINLDLEQLDHMMQELRHELADVPPANREQVVRAMIDNYKAKTAILERVIKDLNTTKQPEKDNSDAGHEIKNL